MACKSTLQFKKSFDSVGQLINGRESLMEKRVPVRTRRCRIDFVRKRKMFVLLEKSSA